MADIAVKNTKEYVENATQALDTFLNALDNAVVDPNWDEIEFITNKINYLAVSVITAEELGSIWD